MRGKTMTDRSIRTSQDLDDLAFWENGLLPVVAQDEESLEVLMVAFANREALERTLALGQMHYWSRSRQELWRKGATSGNVQDLVSLHADCDGDTLLARVRQRGPACHTGESTCFGEIPSAPGQEASGGPSESGSSREALPDPENVLPALWSVLESRDRIRPEGSYTVRLLEDENLRLKKLGEETAELLTALARKDDVAIPGEAADLIYHLLVALLGSGVTFQALLDELDARRP
jgi:phosphoribosyl-ATP pyrophosphohydrolase/phosphoribosyl-AMP cyclohydrolase